MIIIGWTRHRFKITHSILIKKYTLVNVRVDILLWLNYVNLNELKHSQNKQWQHTGTKNSRCAVDGQIFQKLILEKQK